MCVAQGVSHLAGDSQGVIQRKLALTAKPVAEALPFDERHGEPELPSGFT